MFLPTRPYGAVGEITAIPGGTYRPLASCDLFTSQLLCVEEAVRVGSMESFTSLLCLEGGCELTAADGTALPLKKGASVFLPAGMTAKLTGRAQLLCSRV